MNIFYTITLITIFLLAIGIRLLRFYTDKPRDEKLYMKIKVALYVISVILSSYFTFDKLSGTLVFAIAMLLYGYMIYLSKQDDKSLKQHLLGILLFPLWVLLFSYSSMYHLSTYLSSLFPISFIAVIFFGRMFPSSSWKDWLSAGIGLILAIVVLYFAFDGFGPVESYQENIARAFIEDELEYTIKHLHSEPSLRGEPCEVYASVIEDQARIKMIYRNSNIIDWDIEISENLQSVPVNEVNRYFPKQVKPPNSDASN